MPRTFGEVLKEARKKKGLTQEELAEQLPCSRTMYTQIESETIYFPKRISIEFVKKVCTILEIDANELFGLK